MALTVDPQDLVARAESSGTPGLLGRHPMWERVPLEDVVDVLNGFPFKSGQFNRDGDGTPLIRIRDVGREITPTYYRGGFEPRYLVRTGDIIVGMDGDFRVSRWHGPPALLNQRVCKMSVRCDAHYDARFLVFVLQGYLDAIGDATSSVTVKHLSSKSLQHIPLPLPPLAEQHRIVEALEDHLSVIEAGERSLVSARQKVTAFRKSALLTLVPENVPDGWELTTVSAAGKIDLGRQRHPDWHHGPEMHPYLRVANVFEDRIDMSDVMEMDFSGVFERFRLRLGDVLLNEGQSPHLVGRPALYRGEPPNVAFTNSLLRFRARDDVLPEWALMVFRRHLHARRFMREIRITTNIAHLSAKRLATVEFPIPPVPEQKRRIQQCEELMSYADSLEGTLRRAAIRSGHLRNALLTRAFTGKLVPQSPGDEPATVLLERIRAERQARSAPRAKRARKAVPKQPPQGPQPPRGANPIPTDAVQQELPL